MRRAFTLLEVLIALAVLSVGLVVLVDTQATSLFMDTDRSRTVLATTLAEEKMTEVLVRLEREGWTDQDIEEDGDFEDFGEEDFRGDGVDLDFGRRLEGWHWAYTVRAIDLQLPGDVWNMVGELADAGYWGEEKTENLDLTGAPNLSSLGITPDVLADVLSNYIREVRVRVWWGEDPDEAVELVHHVINISGRVQSTGEQQQ